MARTGRNFPLVAPALGRPSHGVAAGAHSPTCSDGDCSFPPVDACAPAQRDTEAQDFRSGFEIADRRSQELYMRTYARVKHSRWSAAVSTVTPPSHTVGMTTKREGLSLAGFFARYPDDAAAEAQFVAWRWPTGPECPHCGSTNVATIANRKPMPYRCRGCRKHFSVTVGTVMQSTKLGLRTWLLAVYLLSTDAKGRSSLKLGRDLDVKQSTAWHLAHRIRKAMAAAGTADIFAGPVQIDELYVGGLNRNRHKSKRPRIGGGSIGKTPVVGIVDRPTNRIALIPVDHVKTDVVAGLVKQHVAAGAAVYSDASQVYLWLRRLGYQHKSVHHEHGEFVRGPVTTNAVESVWALFRRRYHGTHHWMSPRHLGEYTSEAAAYHNLRPLATVDRMALVAGGMEGLRLRYDDLTARPEAEPVPVGDPF